MRYIKDFLFDKKQVNFNYQLYYSKTIKQLYLYN